MLAQPYEEIALTMKPLKHLGDSVQLRKGRTISGILSGVTIRGNSKTSETSKRSPERGTEKHVRAKFHIIEFNNKKS